MARAGVETAWWDLIAFRHGTSLAERVTRRLHELGVAPRWCERASTIECGIALGIPQQEDAAVLADWVDAAVRAGYRRVKLKVRPGWDEEPVSVTREVLRRMRAELPITVDANGAYPLDGDAADVRRLDALGLLYIEQPFPGEALWDLRELHRMLETPICLDETLTSDDVARQILELDGPTVWNVKVQRVGGLEEACRIYARAVRSGVKLWGGTMPESGIGAQAMLALGCHRGFVYPSDIEPSERWYAPGSDTIELTMGSDGTMPVPVERPRVNHSVAWREVAVLP
jgi:O-succinylbenzoate synthase